MKISGFTMVRNATKLYYPIKPAIESIVPIVDEFVVALGLSDPDDETEKEILSIGSPKIRIVRTVWDLEKYPRGTVHAQHEAVVIPPRVVTIPETTFIAGTSSGVVSIRTRITDVPCEASVSASSGWKTIAPVAVPGLAPIPFATSCFM